MSINEQGSEMSSILRYKDALPYRDEACGCAVSSKINQISKITLEKHHLSELVTERRRTANHNRMDKVKEMQSSL
jgi:hypothetical protein